MAAQGGNPGLKVAVQAIGLYFLCSGMLHLLQGVMRLLLMWLGPTFSFTGYSGYSSAGSGVAVAEYAVMGVPDLLIASVLLACTDWTTRAVARLPGRQWPADPAQDPDGDNAG
jgi:hypothetical protein